VSLARIELEAGEEHHARATLTRVLTIEPGRSGEVIAVATGLAQNGRQQSAIGYMEVVVDAALLTGDWERAVDGLQTFVRVAPCAPALIKLVELCVDAGLDAPLRAAKAQLADAYLDEGRGTEAKAIAEDLLEGDPGNDAHGRRLSRVVELLDAGAAGRVGERRGGGGAATPVETDAPLEVDLSDALAGLDAVPGAAVSAGAADSYEQGVEHLDAGRVADGVAALEAAAREPRTRFRAAAELGRLHVGRGELQAGVEWLDRAAEAHPETRDEGLAVLYDLADALDRLGETARALALLVEIDADAGEYRDVRVRIEQLARAQTGSSGR